MDSPYQIARDYPLEAVALAKRRVRGLLHPYCLTMASLERLLASAYLQGIVDLVEVQTREPKHDE